MVTDHRQDTNVSGYKGIGMYSVERNVIVENVGRDIGVPDAW